jgi:hypothetical protein
LVLILWSFISYILISNTGFVTYLWCVYLCVFLCQCWNNIIIVHCYSAIAFAGVYLLHSFSLVFVGEGVVWGFELRALCLLGRCSTTWLFLRWMSLYAQAGLDCDPPVCVSSYSSGDGDEPPCSAYWLRWSLMNFFPELASKRNPPNLYLLSRSDYRLEPSYLPSHSYSFSTHFSINFLWLRL